VISRADADGVVDRLVAAGCVAAEAEAEELLGVAPDQATLETWLRRREGGEPLAWITGTVQFCGQKLHVSPGVYVPRVQSEELARRAARLLPDRGRAVDLCTGAGAVAAHMIREVPTATVIGIDIDVRAAVCARRNGVRALVGDLDGPLRRHRELDVVTAVAPYVPTGQLRLLTADVQRHEPRAALDGGEDGLEVVRRVVAAAGRRLRPGGWLLLELGGAQDQELTPALATGGFGVPEPWWDEDGDLRGLAAQATN
jgi:release factor glutamine methyltransferase